MGSPGHQAHPDPRESQALAFLDLQASQELQDRRDSQDPRETPDSLDPLASQGAQASMEHQGLKVTVVFLAHQEPVAPQAPQGLVFRAPPDLQGPPDLSAHQVTKDFQAGTERRATPAPLGWTSLAPLVTVVAPASLELQASWDPQARPARPAETDCRDCQVRRVKWV